MKLILSKDFALDDWRQDILVNWFRCISDGDSANKYPTEFFVEVWHNHLPTWFKYPWMEKMYAKEFYQVEASNLLKESDDIILVKNRVDNFIIRTAKLLVFW